MDLNTVTAIHPARSRSDLAALGEGVAPLAGGSWLFSERQDHLTALVDLMGLRWESLVPGDEGLEVAATCTFAELAAMPSRGDWPAHPLFYQCCTALLGSFKVWNVATVGGNVCASLPAGPMTSLFSSLDAEALVWRADGSDERVPVARFVTGNGTNVLGPGDVLRSFHVPTSSLEARSAYRKIALSPLGRSGAVIVGLLRTDDSFLLTVSGATVRPEQLRFDALPGAEELAARVGAIDSWFTDPHGAADWRRSVSTALALEILNELGLPPGESPLSDYTTERYVPETSAAGGDEGEAR
ncbi:FAD binding domain-containing protein [Herbiconiux sp. KACC 21604]|uniref:FAD binding domain-containing protein n=1 Tax=unclassified Herbiconiux TaxID=2618217 RepID=UPI0014920582|nr:FAD binding domain-containing protein [Herbiconiux sp. SALV-R1]QJU54021.1 FAD-binding molybdopterin dehydrogenase [Herbiconiux sp. SALV-R1]WPO85054.1 FAD binding domain-containing protein [Herbiconiux sp. KACC 21604]